MTAISIRRATPGDAGAVAALVATAFSSLPAVAWLVPDEAARPRVFTANFRIFVEHAIEHGHIDLIDEDPLPAACVWFPNTGPMPGPPDYEERLAAACESWTDRFRVLDTLFDKHHPSAPHHHLAFAAVLPTRQGAGLGSALMRHHHAHLDNINVAAYLEASHPRNRHLYERHGYECGEPFTLPDGPPFWPMWRPPASQRL